MKNYDGNTYVLIDASGYVNKAVGYPAAGYTKLEVELPNEFVLGCYQLIDGEFILDQEKYDELYPEEQDPWLPKV